MEGHPGAWEPRDLTALRGSLFLSRSIAALREGDPQLNSGAQEPQPQSTSLLFVFMASYDERVTPGTKSHERDVLEGPACGGLNPEMAALCSWARTAQNWTKGRAYMGLLSGGALAGQRFPDVGLVEF